MSSKESVFTKSRFIFVIPPKPEPIDILEWQSQRARRIVDRHAPTKARAHSPRLGCDNRTEAIHQVVKDDETISRDSSSRRKGPVSSPPLWERGVRKQQN